MFRRLHIQLTFFSALIIGIVIFIMTTACNFIAENSTRQNAWNTFQNNAISCISHLETQSIISSDWILQAEKNYDISMDIRDNGNSLYLKNYRRILWMKRFSGRQKKSLLLPMHLIFPIPVRSVN